MADETDMVQENSEFILIKDDNYLKLRKFYKENPVWCNNLIEIWINLTEIQIIFRVFSFFENE